MADNWPTGLLPRWAARSFARDPSLQSRNPVIPVPSLQSREPPVVYELLNGELCRPAHLARDHVIPLLRDDDVPLLFQQVHSWEAAAGSVRRESDYMRQNITHFPLRACWHWDARSVSLLTHDLGELLLLSCVNVLDLHAVIQSQRPWGPKRIASGVARGPVTTAAP
ncbi:MAG TPA: hypothetical protein VNG12_03620 [Acidimicrobiales bacterium]|nr:hypothetical protein [Acidimicrobiales bacterium]